MVPFAVEGVGGEVYRRHFVVCDFGARRIGCVVDFGFDVGSGSGGGRGNQLDDGLVADQRFAAPVLGDEGEKLVLDLVPLAGPRRQMTDGDGHAKFSGERLEFSLP